MTWPVFIPVTDTAQTPNHGKAASRPASGGTGPLVSILMPVFDAAATLEEAVRSVQAQTHTSWELIVIDDGSTDASPRVAQELAKGDKRIRLVRQAENGGAARARNAGLQAACGRYIAFLDADDLWLPEKLTRQIAFMQETGAALSYTGFWRMRAGTGARRAVTVPDAVDRATLLRGNVIGCLTAIYDRQVLGDCPMPDLRMRHDFALWLDILSRIDVARGLDAPLAVHRQQPGSLTSNTYRATWATWAMYRRHMGLPAHRAAWYLSRHLLRRVLRG